MGKHSEDYFKNYHKNHYKANTTVRDKKNHEVLGKLLLTLVGCSRRDAGKIVSAEETHIKYDKFSESDLLIVNQQNLATTLGVSQMTICRLLTKASEKDYVRFVDGYRFEGSTHTSDVYIVAIDKIMEDFADVEASVNDLTSAYYSNLHSKEDSESAKVKINNACMKQTIWRDLKAMIDKANEDLPEYFKVQFLNTDKNGNVHDSRYYSKICSTYNPEKHEDSDRIEKIQDLFGTKEKIIEIDVNSMMYRTSYNLVHDEYLSKDADVYYELYKLMVVEPMSLSVFKKDARQLIKKELMSIYMDPRSVYCKCNAKNVGLNEVQIENRKSMILTLFGMEYEEFLNRLKEALYQFLSVYDFEGDKRVFFGRMFFKYEALVYYYMNEAFKALGIKSVNVYDGFYFIEGTCSENIFYEVYTAAIDKAKVFLVEHNHDLVRLYGKTFTLKYKIYKKVETKKSERSKGTYDVSQQKVVERLSAEDHQQKQNEYVQSVIEKCKELEAQGKKVVY